MINNTASGVLDSALRVEQERLEVTKFQKIIININLLIFFFTLVASTSISSRSTVALESSWSHFHKTFFNVIM
jgi:hypothetical protein